MNPNVTNRRSCFVFQDGRDCTLVRLANEKEPAIVETSIYLDLLRRGLSPNWFWNLNRASGEGYVRAKIRGTGTIVIARLIAGASFKETVSYRNGNRRDLRRANLVVSSGGRAYKDCATLLEKCYCEEQE